MDGGNPDAHNDNYDEHPFFPVQEGLNIWSFFNASRGRFTEWEGVVTVPFVVLDEFPVISVQYRITEGDEFRQYVFNFVPKIGEDVALALAFDDLQFYSNTREFRSFYIEGSDFPQSTEAIGKTPGNGTYGDIVVPFEDATGQEIKDRAREAAVDALADKLKFPVALDGSPSLEPIYDTRAQQNGDVIVDIYGLEAHYNVIEGFPVTP